MCGEFAGTITPPPPLNPPPPQPPPPPPPPPHTHTHRPVMQSFDVFFYLCLNKQLNKQSRSTWFETAWHSIRRHCNDWFETRASSCLKNLSQWYGALMSSLFCASTNGWVIMWDAGDLGRHRTHYDITVIDYIVWCVCPIPESHVAYDRADSRFAPSQCDSALLCNDVPHWLGASLESALLWCLQSSLSLVIKFVHFTPP